MRNVNEAASYLLNDKASPALKTEATNLLNSNVLTPSIKTRLFDLFIQRDDMITFLSDFNDLKSVLGT